MGTGSVVYNILGDEVSGEIAMAIAGQVSYQPPQPPKPAPSAKKSGAG